MLLQNLRNQKKDISKWVREVYGNIENQRTKALLELGKLDQLAELGTLSTRESTVLESETAASKYCNS